MGDDRSEQLARQIRAALGPLNDESDALTLLIGKLRARLAQLEAVAEADKAENLRLREALTMTKRLFCEAHLRVCQLHKVAEAAEMVSERFTILYDMLVGRREGLLSEGIEEVAIEVDVMRRKLAALRDGGDDGK